MSYRRVIPRDLFNEANLLKCYGQIYINLETANLPAVTLENDGDAFDVQEDPSSGALYVANVQLTVNGLSCDLFRPMNSREPWPLMLTTAGGEEVCVFDDSGAFSKEMIEYLRAESEQDRREPKTGHRPS